MFVMSKIMKGYLQLRRDIKNRKRYLLNPFCASIFAKKVLKHRGTHHYLVNVLSIALKFSMVLKTLKLFQWQATINRVTLANMTINNKMKEKAK